MSIETVENIEQKLISLPSRAEAESAVKTLLAWIGENPNREGLQDTPKRVIDAYQDFFSGYQENPETYLSKTFTETSGYRDMVLLNDLRFESHCEHHMVPIIGRAHVAYLPDKRIVGLSKLARVVDVFAKRLQIQESMTVQIANAIDQALKPRGVAVVIQANHHCMSTRGVHKTDQLTTTRHFIAAFRDDQHLKHEFLQTIGMLPSKS
jgi:GTP cyclohydrolase IA